MQDIYPVLTAVWAVLVAALSASNVYLHTESLFAEFDTLLHVAFDSNLAYSALLRVGQLQGARLHGWRDHQLSHVTKVQAVLKRDNPNVDFDPTSCTKVAQEVIDKAHESLSGKVPIFALASLFMMIVSLILLVAIATGGGLRIPNYASLLMLIVLFVPIPIGLFVAHRIVARAEKTVTAEFDKFIGASVFLKKPDASASEIDQLRKQLNVPRPNTFMRVLGMVKPRYLRS